MSKSDQIVIVDYGMGNLRSVSKALQSLGADVVISSRGADIELARKLILPGVGAFPAAMDELSRQGLIEPITQAIQRGIPYLGICLGLQLLFQESEEGGRVRGLGILEGRVRRFEPHGGNGSGPLKIPHMGWNQVQGGRHLFRRRCPLLKGIPDGSFVYFVHSYYAEPADGSVVELQAEHGRPFAAMVWRRNLFATQFHPEKSQAVGLKLLENFVAL